MLSVTGRTSLDAAKIITWCRRQSVARRLSRSSIIMECIPKNKLLEHHEDTLMVVRKEFNLDKPGVMADAIRILREWIEKQPHFKKKNFNDEYLEIVITDCKGSLERAKKQIDRMCTLRTLLPHFFEIRNPKTDFGILFDVFTPVVLPKLTPEHYRVFWVKANDKAHLIKDYLGYFAYDVMICDYLKAHDYCRGYICVLDFMQMNIMDYLANLSPILLRQTFSIFIEGYGMRIKGIYIYTPSKLVDTLVSLLKQVASPKVASRIHAFKTFESLPEIVPLDMLPEDYGGKEKSLKLMCDDWIETLASEENINYLKDFNQAGTNETLRPIGKFNEEYAGMPGTFRMLSVD